MMKDSSKNVLNYLKANHGTPLTADDVAAALNVSARSVNGSFTAGIQRKGLGTRVEAEVELDNGDHKKVKFLTLTDAGLAFDPDAADEVVVVA